MKKFLSILLVFVLMFSLVSCGESNDADTNTTKKEKVKEETKTDKQLVEETVKEFFDAFSELDFEGMKAQLSDPDLMPEEFNAYNGDVFVENALSSIPQEVQEYVDQSVIENYMERSLNKMKEYISYEITDIKKVNDEEYKATVDLTLPDSESSNADEVLGEYMSEEGTMLLVQQLAEEGVITENSTQEEVLGALMLKIFEIASDALDEIQFETSTSAIEYTVVKTDDGKWLIQPQTNDEEK